MRDSGFTLLELLLTIGIIFVLTAMLASSTALAKFSAKKAVCDSYKRQLITYYYLSEFETGESSPSYTLQPLMEAAVPLSDKCYGCHHGD
jgi:type II secretory pathway pseudopilin PulG